LAGSGFKGNQFWSVDDGNAPATAADLGLRRDQIHEARQIRDWPSAPASLNNVFLTTQRQIIDRIRLEAASPEAATLDSK